MIFEISIIFKWKDTLNVKLKPSHWDWTESFKRLIRSGTKRCHVAETWNSAVALFGIIFVVEMAQKQEIVCLKRKSLNINFLFIEQSISHL